MAKAKTDPESSSPTNKIQGFEKWEIEDAARTIQRAMELKAKPKLLKLALTEIKKQEKAAKEAVSWADNLV